jgi:hypothetical protein
MNTVHFNDADLNLIKVLDALARGISEDSYRLFVRVSSKVTRAVALVLLQAAVQCIHSEPSNTPSVKYIPDG